MDIVQTRPDVAVFVAALQRKLQEPNGQDLINLNRVLSYVKRKPLSLVYHKIPDAWKLYVISDSSFKGEDDSALAMRSGIIALGSKQGPKPGLNHLQLIEFVSANNINLAMTEVLSGHKTATELARVQELGKNCLEMETIIDARSVFDCVAAPAVKTTTDQLMLIHALKLKELLARKSLLV